MGTDTGVGSPAPVGMPTSEAAQKQWGPDEGLLRAPRSPQLTVISLVSSFPLATRVPFGTYLFSPIKYGYVLAYLLSPYEDYMKYRRCSAQNGARR